MPLTILNRFCNIKYYIINLGRIKVASKNSLVPFVRGQDVQCYNYTLPYQFAKIP